VVALALDDEERALLEGEAGPGSALAMRLLVRMAELQGAGRLLPVTGAHVDGAVYEGDAVVDFVEHLARLDARVRVPTTLNAVSVEVGTWQRLGLEPRFGQQATRIVDAYLAMGLRPTFSCAPYQQRHPLPQLGDQVAWGESNAVAYCNSVLGARTERYGDFLDISAAVAGRVPAVGLHLTENRRATMRLVLDDAITTDDMASELFWPLLGYVVGERAEHRVAALEGITVRPTDDQLKSLLAAAASSGAVALLHIVGVTPEAQDAAAPFDGPLPAAEVIRRVDLVEAAQRLTSRAEGAPLDAVALGSPHFSPAEFSALARLVHGRTKSDRVRVLVTTSRTSRAIAEASGALGACEAFGAEVVSDTCILLAPLLAPGVNTLMTNSGKYAHYSPGRLNVNVVLGTLADAVRSAELGRVAFADGRWRA
jgi:predicted aconitase